MSAPDPRLDEIQARLDVHVKCTDCGKCRVSVTEEWCPECDYWITAKTTAAVLAEHEMDFTYDGKQTGCSCGHWQARGPVSAHADHAAHQAAALSASGFGLVADAKAEAKRDAAAAGLRAVSDVWAAGGRATVRLSELSEIAKDVTSGEWDQHIEWSLKDIDRERSRATKATP